MREAIYEDDLRLYVEQHIVREVPVSRHEGGEWCLAVRLGGPTATWLPVRSQREAVRTWASLDTLTRWANLQQSFTFLRLQPALIWGAKTAPRLLAEQ